MKILKSLFVIVCTAVLLSACAGNQRYNRTCVVVGALIGGGAGALAEDDAPVVAGGALLGGIIGYLVCGNDADSDGDGVVDSKDDCPGTASGVLVNSSGCPIDSDGDGVADGQDECPQTPQGAPVNSAGCPFDSDGDGVSDGKDHCPNTPSGAAVDENGCQIDSDGDTVYDSDDDCPDTPRGQGVNEKGCHIIFSLNGVNFATDSDVLTQDAVAKLDLAVQMLRENSGVKVRVEGHTDSSGSDDYNQQLSQRRAESVVEHLVMKGVDRARLEPQGHGERSPVADNDTPEGRAQNRRVDFAINN